MKNFVEHARRCLRSVRHQYRRAAHPYQFAITNVLPNSVGRYVPALDNVFFLQLPDDAATKGGSSTNVHPSTTTLSRFSKDFESSDGAHSRFGFTQQRPVAPRSLAIVQPILPATQAPRLETALYTAPRLAFASVVDTPYGNFAAFRLNGDLRVRNLSAKLSLIRSEPKLEYWTAIIVRSVVIRLSIVVAVLAIVRSIRPVTTVIPGTIIGPVASLVFPVMMTMVLLTVSLGRSRQHRES